MAGSDAAPLVAACDALKRSDGTFAARMSATRRSDGTSVDELKLGDVPARASSHGFGGEGCIAGNCEKPACALSNHVAPVIAACFGAPCIYYACNDSLCIVLLLLHVLMRSSVKKATKYGVVLAAVAISACCPFAFTVGVMRPSFAFYVVRYGLP